jgi:hypothetical protein
MLLHAMVHVVPVQSFGPGQEPLPEQTMSQAPASHEMPFSHESLFVHATLQVEPAQSISPAHEFMPMHSMSHAAPAVQSMSSLQELSPHPTMHGTLGGHVIGPLHVPGLVQSILQAPPSVQVPPASAHSVAQSGP